MYSHSCEDEEQLGKSARNAANTRISSAHTQSTVHVCLFIPTSIEISFRAFENMFLSVRCCGYRWSWHKSQNTHTHGSDDSTRCIAHVLRRKPCTNDTHSNGPFFENSSLLFAKTQLYKCGLELFHDLTNSFFNWDCFDCHHLKRQRKKNEICFREVYTEFRSCY